MKVINEMQAKTYPAINVFELIFFYTHYCFSF